MFQLKQIEQDAVPRALSKAERYRLLNEPREAESICRDILAVEPGNADARACLILALTDLFDAQEVAAAEVRPLVERLSGEFERRYYAGMIEERWGKSLIKSGFQASIAYGFIRTAMHHFEAAQAVAPQTNDDAVLRWNACVRLIERHALTPPVIAEDTADSFADDVPVR